MANENGFRGKLFGGFNRKDVADYIEKLAAERNRLKAEADQRRNEALSRAAQNEELSRLLGEARKVADEARAHAEELAAQVRAGITRAEAAVILGNMLNAATPTVTPTFSDSEEIPAWAAPSIHSLSAMGVMTPVGGSISPLSEVTRGDAAELLCALMEAKQ